MHYASMASDTHAPGGPSGPLNEVGHERTADVATMILTDQTLGDVVFALQNVLDRVREEDLTSPTTQTHWRYVREWLNEAEAFSQSGGNKNDFVRLKAFPITGTELRTLQLAVDQTERRREAQQALAPAARRSRHQHLPVAPHQTIRRVTATSILLLAALVILLLINIAWLALYHLGIIVVPHLSLILGINSLATAIVFLAWSLHHWHLLRHRRAVHWHRPQVAHFFHHRAH